MLGFCAAREERRASAAMKGWSGGQMAAALGMSFGEEDGGLSLCMKAGPVEDLMRNSGVRRHVSGKFGLLPERYGQMRTLRLSVGGVVLTASAVPMTAPSPLAGEGT
ncbi:hypothetical protein BRAO375_4660002 [Bradyrhizobium sp. ORS 375]|nr:hypothetical protein BRAO375_4660002 [Bradyrhizobium sp. ORS 375]